MFTENPVTGADERMIEASWGLGEAVVAGLVIPDHYRIDRSGQVLRAQAGTQDASRSAPPASGGTVEEKFRPIWLSGCAWTTPNSRSWVSSHVVAKRYTALRATSSGRSPAGRSISSSAAPSRQGVHRTRSPSRPAPGDPVEALERVPLFAELERREVEQIARLFKAAAILEGRDRRHGGLGRRGLLPDRVRGGDGVDRVASRADPAGRATTSARSP